MLTAFVLIAALLLAASMLFVLPPLLARPAVAEQRADPAVSNAAIYREQLAELAADHARGALDSAQYEQLRGEVERRLLDDAGSMSVATTADATAAAPTRRPALVLLALMPAAALLLFSAVGEFGTLQKLASAPAASAGGAAAQARDAMAQARARLQSSPADLDALRALTMAALQVNDLSQALDAMARALKLDPQNPGLLADYADVLAASRGRRLQGEPEALVQRALAVDPQHLKALALAGSARFEQNDFDGAVRFWSQAVTLAPADAPFARSLQGSLAEARARAAGGAPTAQPVAAAVTVGSGSVSGAVSLAPALRARVQPDDTLFIVARAADGGGPPLAVLRRRAAELPFDFALDDAQSMNPAATLSAAGRVIVAARVSRSGQAAPQPGDLEGASAPVAVGTRGLRIVIDRERP
jgi:cytochrome c-type biogenesis protein CcmH